jgi:hypothetical protein
MKCPSCGHQIDPEKPLDIKVIQRIIVDKVWKTDRPTLLRIAQILRVELPK